MKPLIWCCIVTVINALVCVPDAAGQDSHVQTRAVGHRAVVDVEKLKKNHLRYQAILSDLASDKQANDKLLAKKQEEIDETLARRDALPALSEEAVTLGNLATKLKAELDLARRDFAEEQRRQSAKADIRLYQEIKQEAAYFSQKYKIHVVLNHRSAPISEDMTLEEAKALFTGNVVYHKNVDITHELLRRLGPPTHPRHYGPLPRAPR